MSITDLVKRIKDINKDIEILKLQIELTNIEIENIDKEINKLETHRLMVIRFPKREIKGQDPFVKDEDKILKLDSPKINNIRDLYDSSLKWYLSDPNYKNPNLYLNENYQLITKDVFYSLEDDLMNFYRESHIKSKWLDNKKFYLLLFYK